MKLMLQMSMQSWASDGSTPGCLVHVGKTSISRTEQSAAVRTNSVEVRHAGAEAEGPDCPLLCRCDWGGNARSSDHKETQEYD